MNPIWQRGRPIEQNYARYLTRTEYKQISSGFRNDGARCVATSDDLGLSDDYNPADEPTDVYEALVD